MTTTFNKRSKERARQDKAREKAEDRANRKVEKANRAPVEPGEDPDLAGIVPGPQPLPEWVSES
ncbi:MAG: hypothetical protein EOO73_26655 [Myxococcales bacterium]|nr:MAG: hypothetical protein EOO73_26655 [Myxococcales bacterium]